VNLIDNGTHVDSLSYKNLYFKVNGVTMTNVRFTNSLGQVIDSIGPGDNIVHVTFISGAGESSNPLGTPTEYILGGRFTGYNHPSDGDIGSIEPIVVDSPLPSAAYKYANAGITPNNLNAKMWTSAIANAGAIVCNTVWYDLSAGISHSSSLGAGSADAKNASIGVIDNTSPQVWVQ
jgi:hypothetical protein